MDKPSWVIYQQLLNIRIGMIQNSLHIEMFLFKINGDSWLTYLYSFNQYLCAYFVPVAFLGVKGKVMNKVDKNLC